MLWSGTHHTQLQMKLINEIESGKNKYFNIERIGEVKITVKTIQFKDK